VTGEDGAVSEIQTAITAIDATVPFAAEYKDVAPDATDSIQQAITKIDGRVFMTPNAQTVYDTISDIDGKHITVYVDYVEGDPPEDRSVTTKSGRGVNRGGSSYAAGYSSGGGLTVNMTVNFNGPAEPAAVQRAIYSGVEQLYADIAREGVSW
jgi:hypothetical protein